MDITKLPPAPWFVSGPKSNNGLYDVRTAYVDGFCQTITANVTKSVAEYIVLSRQALDIMMRRKWWAERYYGDKWIVVFGGAWGDMQGYVYESYIKWTDRPNGAYDDPFTALVEADKLYSANVENKGKEQG